MQSVVVSVDVIFMTPDVAKGADFVLQSYLTE